MNNLDFKVKPPLWGGVIIWVMVAISLGLIITAAVLQIAGVSAPDGMPLAFYVFGGILFLVGILGLYSYYREAFYFEDGTFYCVKMFKKTQSAKASHIHHIAVYESGYTSRVYFYDREHNTLMNFMSVGHMFFTPEFKKVLDSYNIPIFFQGEDQGFLS